MMTIMKKFEKLSYPTIILILSIIISFSYCFKNNDNKNKYEHLINTKYSIPSDEFINILNLDEFTFGNIKDNSTIYYKVNILNDTEQIFFDYQSEYGCLSIGLNDSNNSFMFCAEGTNNIFSLNKSDILKTLENNNDSISNISFIIGVGCSNLEMDKNIEFDYSLKVSIRKPDINIFEINTEHKSLCKMEKVNESKYRCIFMITNNLVQDENKLIIYSLSKNNMKLNVFADFINKTYYNDWNVEYLSENIPNENSPYNNYNKKMDFIIITNNSLDNYIYISVESNSEETIEIIAQTLSNCERMNYPINNLLIYNLNTNSTNINLDFNASLNDFSLSLVTLYGKAKINLGYDESTEYITDIRENKFILMIDADKCHEDSNKCKLILNKLEENDENDIGYVFYISYTKKSQNILNELAYGKSNKLLCNKNQFPIILYEYLPNINSSININLQMYDIKNDNISIEALVLSKKDIYELKLNYNNISDYDNKIEGKFDPILSVVNIYFTYELINSYNISGETCVAIYISNNNNIFNDNNKVIVETTILLVNNLIYPSERIYHYGKLNNEKKVVYKLEGKSQYHLMRLEFGSNSDTIGWSLKRTNDDINYMKNDTDLSFVTEKWINGRELLTMYIEQGEDIYLTIFQKSRISNIHLTSYAFKYINSAKNGDFNNYLIKSESLTYNSNEDQVIINQINNIPSTKIINYYLKIINDKEYIKDEGINTIAIIQSNSSLIIKGITKDNHILFNLNNTIKKNNTYYMNVYSSIINNYSEFDYLSYSSLIVNSYEEKANKKKAKYRLIIASFSIGGSTLLILLIRLIYYCSRRRRLSNYITNNITFIANDDYYDDDELLS